MYTPNIKALSIASSSLDKEHLMLKNTTSSNCLNLGMNLTDKSTVATLSNKQLSTDCLFSVSILPGKDTDVSQFNRTSVEVFYNIVFTFEIFTT